MLDSDKAPKEMVHLRYLDALRGIAILMVIFTHAAIVSEQYGKFMTACLSGQRGVQLFYIISAFTLCMSLDRRSEKEKNQLQNFFIRRFFRIAPLFYAAIVANLFFQGLAPRPEALEGLKWWEVASGFFFLNGLSPNAINSVAIGGWSVAVETTFYCLLPWLHSRFNDLWKCLRLLLVSCIAAPAISYSLGAVFPASQEYFQFLWFPIEFPVFVMGMVAYHLSKLLPKWSIHVGGGIGLVALGAEIFLSSLPNTNTRLYWSSLAFVPLVLGLSVWNWKFLVNQATIFLGRISYSLYLTHFFALIIVTHLVQKNTGVLHSEWLRGTLPGFVVTFAAVLAISVVISVVTFKLIEEPGISLGRRIIARRENRAGDPAISIATSVSNETRVGD